jgi:hypothetical protein
MRPGIQFRDHRQNRSDRAERAGVVPASLVVAGVRVAAVAIGQGPMEGGELPQSVAGTASARTDPPSRRRRVLFWAV